MEISGVCTPRLASLDWREGGTQTERDFIAVQAGKDWDVQGRGNPRCVRRCST